jgi:GT2 family glycosyltransferase
MRKRTDCDEEKEQTIAFDIINDMSHKLAIITVVYENYTVLDDFIRSLSTQTSKNFHLYVADLSAQKKPISVEGFSTTVIPAENKGYAHGVNLGIREALKHGCDRFCVMNDDTLFDPEFTDTVEKSIELFPESLIGGKIYYASGYEYHALRYKPEEKGNVLWYAGGIMDWANVFTRHRGVDEVDHGQYDTVEETQFITGCLMCFDKEAFKTIGDWDESYFLYYEDADFCERARRKKVRLIYNPSMKIWHKNSQSTDGAGSPLHVKYQEKNRVKFGLKYAPLRTKVHLVKNSMFGFGKP